MSTRTSLPEPQRTVARYVDTWVAEGLLDDEAADALYRDLEQRAGTEPAPEPDEAGSQGGIERLLDVAKTLAFETLGYLGAAVSVGALVVLLDVAEWPDLAHVLLLGVVAVVAGWGTVSLTPPTSGTTRRLAAVTGVVASLATGGALALAVDPFCSTAPGAADPCSYEQEFLRPLVAVLPALAVAVGLYRRHRHLLTHAAMGGFTLAAVVLLVEAVLGPDVAHDVRELTLGAALVLVSGLWIFGSETERLVPSWVGTFAAAAVFFSGITMITNYDAFFLFDTSDDATILASLMAGAVFGLIGVLGSRYRLVVVGSLALLVTVPATLTEVLGLSGTTTALVLLPVGILLTVWAVVEGRASLIQGDGSDVRSRR